MESFKITHSERGRFQSPISIWCGTVTRAEDHPSFPILHYELVRKRKDRMKFDRKELDGKRLLDIRGILAIVKTWLCL